MNSTLSPRPGICLAIPRHALSLALTSIAIGSFASSSRAQMTFSIDYRGPTIATPGPAPITEGDILTPGPPTGAPAFGAPPPVIFITGGPGGLGLPAHPGCVGHPPGFPCGVEVDALSYGIDFPVPMGPLPAGTYVFSVDEWSAGIPGSPAFPNVISESPAAVCDAAADVMRAFALPPSPLPPGPPIGHSGWVDGNGVVSGSGAVYPGSGIVEPLCPVAGPGARPGDNLDAVDFNEFGLPLPFGAFFSLDDAPPTPCPNFVLSGSAAANGFLPGAILNSVGVGPPAVYATPVMLGLDLIGGPGSDDLDALALWENGVAGFTAGGPYSWTFAAPTDMCLFSLRLGSATIGTPDAIFGIPIEAGDILVPMGIAGVPPGIFIAAEVLGLTTTRSGFGVCADEMDALDTLRIVPPAEPGAEYCFGDGLDTVVTALCPCTNFGGPGRGCANSNPALMGAHLSATGTTFPNTVLFTCDGIPNGNLCTFLRGTANTPAGFVFGDGVRCLSGTLIRFGSQISGPAGGNPANTVSSGTTGFMVGTTRYYGLQYRNPTPLFCPPATFNISNGYRITW